MLVRVAVVAGTCVLGAVAAKAEELGPEQARAFVVGKLFSYTCFDGTVGMGRIFADGSVVGTSSPVANSVNSLVQAVILNYMGLAGTDGNFATLMSGLGISQNLGSASALAGLTAFNKIT